MPTLCWVRKVKEHSCPHKLHVQLESRACSWQTSHSAKGAKTKCYGTEKRETNPDDRHGGSAKISQEDKNRRARRRKEKREAMKGIQWPRHLKSYYFYAEPV